MLDTDHHQGLRLAWAFKTSPVQSLYTAANEQLMCNVQLR